MVGVEPPRVEGGGGGFQVNEEAPSKFMHWFAPLLGASSMGKGIARKQTSKEGHRA